MHCHWTTAATAWRPTGARTARPSLVPRVGSHFGWPDMYPAGHVTPDARIASREALWHALSHPLRRRLIDLLRSSPMTTSDLVSQVGVSRFAVMKHLTALQRAGLLVIAREGRLRWNRLNPLPLVELHRRWVLPEEAAHADRLLRLQHHSLHPEVVRMPSLNTFRALDIVIELDIAAPPPRVWEALTRDISQWWPGKFYVGTAPRRFVIEAFVGGRVFEDWDDGAGSLFGTVTSYQAPHTLQWAADLSADFGGPARTVTTFRIAEGGTPGTSRLTFRDTPFGQLAPAVQSGLEAGWRWLLTRCFQPWVEEGLRPQRPASVEEAPRHA